MKLTELSSGEKKFAEEHINVLQKCSRKYPDDYYGIVAIGYIHAVEKWCRDESLHKLGFKGGKNYDERRGYKYGEINSTR